MKRVTRGLLTAAMVLGVLLGAWLLPPMNHKLLRLCPTRPGPLPAAHAVPAFARKYGISCSQCHSAFPALNEYGREFRLNGYIRERGKNEGVLETKEGLWTEKFFPWGAIVKSRPYHKSQANAEFRLRPLHELELFVAGGDVARRFSYFMEVEAEDENGFSPKFGELQLGYHPYRFANVLLANRSFYDTDPYQTLSNMGKITVARRRLFAQGQTSGEATDNMKQSVVGYGEVGKDGVGSLYYAAGISGDMNEAGAGNQGAGDKEGEGPKDIALRLAFDSLKGVMFGTFGGFGHEGGAYAGTDKFRYSRIGVDTLVELAGFMARGAFVYSYDRNLTSQGANANARENNRGAYVELAHVFRKDDRPTWVPLIRQDWYQNSDGRRQSAGITAQVSRYFVENLRAMVEYTAETVVTNTPNAVTPRAAKGHSWLAQLELGF